MVSENKVIKGGLNKMFAVNKLQNFILENVKSKKMHSAFVTMACIFTCSCGKKVTYPEDSKPSASRSAASALDTIEIDAYKEKGSSKRSRIYRKKLKNFGRLYLPKSFKVLQGNAGNQVTRVFLNVSEDGYDISCDFMGGANFMQPDIASEVEKGKYYNHFECEDETGNVLDMSSGDFWPMDEGKYIEVEVVGSDPRHDTHVLAAFEIQWL